MKLIAGLLLVAALQQSCIERLAGPPEQIAADAATEFRPYFPRVQAHADPQNQVIMVITCAEGLGLPFFQAIEPQVAAQLQNNAKLKQLRLAGIAEAFGQRIPYNSLVVLFEDRMLVWRRSDGAVVRLPNPPQLLAMYQQGCREGFTAGPPSRLPGEPDPPPILRHQDGGIRLSASQCISLSIALEELRAKSSERAAIQDLMAIHSMYCQ